MRAKDFFTDLYNGFVFCIQMARDVARLIKEEQSSEWLCLSLG